jgi:hypothetical protein
MEGLLFFNGPVQNGGFTFADRPGKATGIRLAAALNELLGNPPAPHLWNTATLAGDLRYREHLNTTGTAVQRPVFEAGLIAAKYDDGRPPPAGAVTDVEPDVTALALEMTEDRLRTGTLSLSTEQIRHCTRCGHMAGTGHHPCKVCGGHTLHARARRVLIAERAPETPVLDFADVHAHRKRAPLHLRNIAANVPSRLILSRTRNHGISLEPLGLPGLVLDPRAGLHITVLAAARAQASGTAVMLLTQNAAANIAAYGQPFLHHDGTRLLYGLHGHIPYDALPALATDYRRYRFTPPLQRAFEAWFLPLYSWHAKSNIAAGQLPNLLKHLHRARLATPGAVEDSAVHRLRDAIRAGGTDWLTKRDELAAVLATTGLGRAADHSSLSS